jgi:hypothetical protein
MIDVVTGAARTPSEKCITLPITSAVVEFGRGAAMERFGGGASQSSRRRSRSPDEASATASVAVAPNPWRVNLAAAAAELEVPEQLVMRLSKRHFVLLLAPGSRPSATHAVPSLDEADAAVTVDAAAGPDAIDGNKPEGEVHALRDATSQAPQVSPKAEPAPSSAAGDLAVEHWSTKEEDPTPAPEVAAAPPRLELVPYCRVPMMMDRSPSTYIHTAPIEVTAGDAIYTWAPQVDHPSIRLRFRLSTE